MLRSVVPRLIVPDPDDAIHFYRRGLRAHLVDRHVMGGLAVHAVLAVGEAMFTLAGGGRNGGCCRRHRSVGRRVWSC